MITCTPQAAAARKHLLDVVRALRDAMNDPHLVEDFTMARYVNPCGTPACALGHYASRTDLQSEFMLHPAINGDVCYTSGYGSEWRKNSRQTSIMFDDQRVIEYFGVSHPEAEDIFGERGCGSARTPQKAADYIESFVAKKWPQWS